MSKGQRYRTARRETDGKPKQIADFHECDIDFEVKRATFRCPACRALWQRTGDDARPTWTRLNRADRRLRAFGTRRKGAAVQ